MKTGIKIDNEGRIRSLGTGRFLATPEGVSRVKVPDGVVFTFLENEPTPKPTDKVRWLKVPRGCGIKDADSKVNGKWVD